MPTETIAAIATPLGKGGVGIIRISGPLVKEIAQALLGKLPSPRYAHFSHFFNETGELIDSGLALFFPNPHSFTGEDVLEIQGHGGPMVQNLLLQRILGLGAKLAQPGEFSHRAFLNNKIDLTQAEAIADLIDSASEQAAKSAMRSLQGEFSTQINKLLSQLIELRIYVEAAIDFPDEEIDFLSDRGIGQRLKATFKQIKMITQAAKQGALLREGITVVIAGKTNAGKSSLLNALCGKESAIVTNIPGTTRDILRENMHLDGIPIHIVDTAGLRESEDLVEQEGIRRAKQEITQADIVLLVIDATETELFDLAPWLAKHPFIEKAQLLIVKNKIDLINEKPQLIICEHSQRPQVSLSAKTKIGLELLTQELKNFLKNKNSAETCFIARQRHLEALSRADNALQQAQQHLSGQTLELLAEELRLAQQALGEITGEVRSDDLLGKIFASFCIGK